MVDLIVKNFPQIFSEHDIKKLFKKHGSVKRIRKHKTKQEATVTMPFQHQAYVAIKELDGSKQLGKQIKVAVDK